MTDQTHFAPQTTLLPDLEKAQENLSVMARAWRIVSAPLPQSWRLRRDMGLTSDTHDPQNETVSTMSRHGIYF